MVYFGCLGLSANTFFGKYVLLTDTALYGMGTILLLWPYELDKRQEIIHLRI
jgi:hypothetical protein